MSEPYSTEFLNLLALLNQAVAASGEPVEGNCFYKHKDPDFPQAEMQHYMADKRANLLAATLGRGRMLEIGTNAGHSALLMLYHNKNLHYTGVDNGQYKYTRIAIDFLSTHFPGRVTYYEGNSEFMLPEMIEKKVPAAFDIVHIDGLHTTHHCEQDFVHSVKLCVPFAWVIFDDADLPNIKKVYDKYVQERRLLAKAPEGWAENERHAIGMLPA